MELVTEINHVGGPWVLVCMLVVLAVPLVAGFTSAVRARRATLDAQQMREAEADASRALRAGLVTIAGEIVDTTGPPVAVHIVELGSHRRGTSQWREVSRTLDARPFEMRHASGERVWIEPGTAPLVVADLHLASTEHGPRQRTRAARLPPGASIFVTGFLSHRLRAAPAGSSESYRGTTTEPTWVMTSGPSGPVRLSSRPLGALGLEWRAFYLGWLVLATVALLVLAVTSRHYFELALRGVVVEGRVVEISRYGGAVTVVVPERDFELSSRIERDDADTLHVGSSVAVVALPDRPIAQLGRAASMDLVHMGIFVLGAAFASMAFLGTQASRQRWWERRALLSVSAGPLDPTAGADEAA